MARTSLPRRPTLKDVAKLAGVSAITASRALSNNGPVREETRTNIRRAAEAISYVHNHTARAFSDGGSRLVALIVPNVSNSVFSSTIEGLNEVFSRAGYSLLIGYSGYSQAEEERLVRSVLGYQPEGVVLTGFTHSQGTRDLLNRSRRPVVETWNIGSEPIDHAIGFSNFEAARAMTNHLVAKGHRRLGYIGGTQTDNDRTQAREAGFRRALADAALPAEETLIASLPIEFDSGIETARRFMREKIRPDAVFVASDIIAAGFAIECQRLGFSVPRDIAVAGFDDTPLASAMEPRLTTVRVPQREIGVLAAETILARVSGRTDLPKSVDVGFELVVRASA